MARADWDPELYDRFRDEREAPFHDLVKRLLELEGRPIRRGVDLGCGSGRLTRLLREATGADELLGVDASAAMVAEAEDAPGVEVELGRIEEFEAAPGSLDLVFSNAALHWIEDRELVFRRAIGWLAPGGRLAVQVPANFGAPPHRLAERIAADEPFRSALGGWSRPAPILAPEEYARLLHALGYEAARVELVVYPHVLPSVHAVAEWMRGTTLNAWRGRLPEKGEASWSSFAARFADELGAVLEVQPDGSVFYPFKRQHLVARRPS